MNKPELTRIKEIKSIRINIDHIEKIADWITQEGMKCNYYAIGIDGSYENFDTLQKLIEAKGTKPKSIAISGISRTKHINILFNIQFCIIQGININSNTSSKIVKLLKSTVPRILLIFPFNWFATLSFVTFLGGIVAFFLYSFDWWILIYFTLFPAVAFFLVGLYNNYVVGISLIRQHEKSSFWKRKKDDILLYIITTFLLSPFAILIWEKVIKPFFENMN